MSFGNELVTTTQLATRPGVCACVFSSVRHELLTSVKVENCSHDGYAALNMRYVCAYVCVHICHAKLSVCENKGEHVVLFSALYTAAKVP